jgi:hypothetical protein
MGRLSLDVQFEMGLFISVLRNRAARYKKVVLELENFPKKSNGFQTPTAALKSVRKAFFLHSFSRFFFPS